MATIVTRQTGASAKGSALTNTEMDNNFINLNVDKYESGDNVSVGTLDVSGLASLDGGIDVDGAFTVSNTSGNVDTTGTLDADGLASLDGGIDVNGSVFTVDTSGNAAMVDVTSTGDHTASIGSTITAAGTTQGDATALSKTFNVVTTATANQGVKLPTAAGGLLYTVINGTAVNIKLYPNTSGTVNSGTANASIDVAAGTTVKLVGTSSTNWNTMVETIVYDSSGNRLN